MKPVIPGSARGKTALFQTGETIPNSTSVDIENHLPQRDEEVSQLELATMTSVDNSDIDSEEEDSEAVNDLEGISVSYDPEAGEDELTFATMGADDVALDMDIECGYITSEESSDESEDDLDDSMYATL